MKRLHCTFSTELLFSAPVTDHTFSLMLTPMETPRQRALQCRVDVDPACHLAQGRDGFGNTVHLGYSNLPHDRLYYGMEALVETAADADDCHSPHPLYKFPTALTAQGNSLHAFWVRWRLANATDGEQAVHLMHALYGAFQYRGGTTGVHTTAEQALSQGCGVCQDYAHILLALLRLSHIPCVYVTGLMLGEGKSHAWVEVFCEGRWLALDPTHDRVVGEDYVKLSQGRDFDDCSIDRGVFRGDGSVTQTQTISAKVESIETY